MLLIVDDDQDIRQSLSEYLLTNGYQTICAENAEAARQALAAHSFQAIILDIMMPGEDGLSLCRHISSTLNIPILMLTAMNEDMDTIIGLEVGADDYITKPFNPRELLARLRAVLRRNGKQTRQSEDEPMVYRFDDWQFDAARQQLTKSDRLVVDLTAGEAKLLQILLDAANRVLSRDFLLEQIGDRVADVFDRSVDNQISRLRKKLETDPRKPDYIKTVRGGGYRFVGAVKTGKNP